VAVDDELGDLTNVSRTELERVAIRRLEIGDQAGAEVLAAELGRRYTAQQGPDPRGTH
jgi:hypothetical protein